MSILLDIVPNHVATDPVTNPWWADVLEHGRSSFYSSYFDINWNHTAFGLKGKVLAPILGNHLPVVIKGMRYSLSSEK